MPSPIVVLVGLCRVPDDERSLRAAIDSELGPCAAGVDVFVRRPGEAWPPGAAVVFAESWGAAAPRAPQAPGLRWVHLARSEDGPRAAAALAGRATVTAASGSEAQGAADYAVGALLAHEKGLLQRRTGAFVAWQALVAEAPGRALAGRRVGVVGLGAVGGRVAASSAALGAAVSGVRRHPERGGPRGVVEVVGCEGLPSVLGRADYVVLCVPAAPEAGRVLGREVFGAVKVGAVLVSVAGTRCLDERALGQALREGRVAAAVVDRTGAEPLAAGHPLRGAPNLVAVARPAATGLGCRTAALPAALEVREFARNLFQWLQGRPLEGRVLPARAA